MDTEGRRRSDNFEDRGAGSGRGPGGGAAPALFAGLLRTLGVRGTLVVVAVVGGIYLFAPASLKQAILGALSGEPSAGSNVGAAARRQCVRGFTGLRQGLRLLPGRARFDGRRVGGGVQEGGAPRLWARRPGLSQPDARRLLAGRGDGRLRRRHRPRSARSIVRPTASSTSTRASTTTMEQRLGAPGDFAQAYVIAHEVGHHVQNLFGAQRIRDTRRDAEPDLGAARAAGRLFGRRLGAHRARLAVDHRGGPARGAHRRPRHRRRCARAPERRDRSPTAPASSGCAGSSAASTAATPAAATPSRWRPAGSDRLIAAGAASSVIGMDFEAGWLLPSATLSHRDQHVRLGVVGGGAAARDLVRHDLELAARRRSAPKWLTMSTTWSGAMPRSAHVVGVEEDDPPPAVDAAVAVVLAVDRGVELVVAAHGRQQQLAVGRDRAAGSGGR